MDTSAIDPEIRDFIAAMQREWAKYPPFETLSLAEARDVAERVRAPLREGGPAMAEAREMVVATPAGPLRVRLYFPVASRPLPLLVYLHGGGFTLFSIDTHDRLMREYAAAAGCAVLGVDYPLAPEAKYPLALDRIVALVRMLASTGAACGIAPENVALGGDSAGANLALAAALKLRDAGEGARVKALLLNYGAFAAETSDEAEARFGGPGAILNREEMAWYWGNYVRGPEDLADPLVAPLGAELSGLPPAVLIVPELDILTEQSLALAGRLRGAGVPVEYRTYEGATHSFLEAMSISALAREGIADAAQFLKRHLR